jgi:hypothetical protein
MATPAPRLPPTTVPPAPESAPISRADARVDAAEAEAEDEAPPLLVEHSRSSWPGPADEDEGASLINAGGPPSTRYRLIAPRQGKRVPKA